MFKKTNAQLFLLFVLIFNIFPVSSDAQFKMAYDLRDYGMVTPVKLQLDGTCWTFGTMSAMEGNLLMTGNWAANGDTGMPNLAEYHLDWWNGFNKEFNGDLDPTTGNGLTVHLGGDYRVSSAYLARGGGAVRDIDGQSHTPAPLKASPDWVYYYARDIEWYTAGADLSRINIIKEKIVNEGILGTCMCWSNSFFDYGEDTHYQPMSSTEDPTHAISIIGWDDNKITQASQPGAWLCKNSWGTSWHQEGFFWISYYDKHCGQHPEMGAISFQDVIPMPYDNIYYHDYHGWRDTKADISEAVNAFTAENGELLVAISFFTAADSVDYTISIYDDTLTNEFTNLLATQTGHIAYTGFHTIDLIDSVLLTKDDNFYVYISLENGGQPFDRTSVVPVLLGDKGITVVKSTASPGESFYRQDDQWHDFNYIEPSGNFCMKALTELGFSFEADTLYGKAPLSVQFAGSSELDVDSWLWDFGDNNSETGKIATNTYYERGAYNIKLSAEINGKIRTYTKDKYVLAIADTIKADSCVGEPGSNVCITLSSNNSAPINYMYIPFEYPGEISLSLDSFNTVGCRTEYFEMCEIIQMDVLNDRFCIFLKSDNTGDVPMLPAGDGNIINIYMSISDSAKNGQTTAFHFDGYNNLEPTIYSDNLNYTLASISSSLVIDGCCKGVRGNINNDANQIIDISDLVALVDFMFQDGSDPTCFVEADLDSSGVIDISDLVYLVDYMFSEGPGFSECY